MCCAKVCSTVCLCVWASSFISVKWTSFGYKRMCAKLSFPLKWMRRACWSCLLHNGWSFVTMFNCHNAVCMSWLVLSEARFNNLDFFCNETYWFTIQYFKWLNKLKVKWNMCKFSQNCGGLRFEVCLTSSFPEKYQSAVHVSANPLSIFITRKVLSAFNSSFYIQSGSLKECFLNLTE